MQDQWPEREDAPFLHEAIALDLSVPYAIDIVGRESSEEMRPIDYEVVSVEIHR